MEQPLLRTGRRLAVLCLVAAVTGSVLLVALPADARAITLSEVAAAEEAAEQAAAALAEAEAALAEARGERDRLEAMLGRVAVRESELQEAASVQAESVRQRIVRMYMVGRTDTTLLLVGRADSFSSRVAYLGAIADRDRSEVIDIAFTTADAVALRAEVQGAIGHWDSEIDARAEVVAARRAAHADVAARFESLQAQWEREEAARQAAFEAELRRQEQELADQLTTTTGPAATTTTTTTISYPWVPSAGVEQWRSLVTEVLARWGLDRAKCAARDGVEFCVGPQIDNALQVMECESGGNPMAYNSSSGTSGLFQNHPYYWQGRVDRIRAYHRDKEPDLPADASIFNPEYNISVAALLVWESRETLLGNRSGGGWSPAVWPEFNFERYESVGRGYSVWGLGPGPWGHWSCGAHRDIYQGSWIHPWAQQREP